MNVCKPESRGLLSNGQLRFLKAFCELPDVEPLSV